MMVWMRGSFSAVGVAAIAVVLAACQSTGSNTANLNTIGAPAQLQAAFRASRCSAVCRHRPQWSLPVLLRSAPRPPSFRLIRWHSRLPAA
jgi:hypothetical protein